MLGSARALACWRWRLAIVNLVVSELFGEAPKRAREARALPIESHLLAVDARKRIPPKQSAADTAAATD
jgi:hypothetical protein